MRWSSTAKTRRRLARKTLRANMFVITFPLFPMMDETDAAGTQNSMLVRYLASDCT